jgi:hypothetical protein
MRAGRALLFTGALGAAGFGGCAGPGSGTGGRGASLGGLGPAVTTRVADVTANVFVLELSLPEGLSRADAEAAETRAVLREAAELALKVTETKIALGLVEKSQGRRGRYEVAGLPRAQAERFWAPALEAQRAALLALPPPESPRPGRLEVRERWRYVTVPPVPQLEEVRLYTTTRDGQFCLACANIARKRHALYLSSLGTPGVDPAALPPGALDAGIEIAGREVIFGSTNQDTPLRVGRPSDGRLTLRQVARCPARIVRVEDTPIIHWGSDVIAWPHREDQTWHELRDAACVGTDDATHEVFGPSRPLPPDTAKNPARFWIEQHRAELARLERGEFKPPLP